MVWLLALMLTHADAATPTKAASAKSAAVAAYPTTVTLTTADGVALQAFEGVPARAENGVVFLHMAGRNKEDWQIVAQSFYRQGMMVSVPDLRGHGANAAGTTATLQPADYTAMVKDVNAAVASLRARGAKRVAIVGAELGANLALVAAADDPGITSVVLLSPGLDVKGVITPDAVKRYGARPALFVASKDDPYGARSATALDAQALGVHRVELYEAAGKGTRMFNREPGLESLVLGFVNSAWSGATAAAAARPTSVEIKVNSTGLETTGPEKDLPPPTAPTP